MSKPDDPVPKEGLPELDFAASKREFIETFFKRGAEFTEELMRENERLRYRVVQLEEERRTLLSRADPTPGTAQSTLRELVARIESLESERQQILDKYAGVERASADFSSRYQDIERENNNLANLYVASYQLHSTLDLREVTQIILEILLNFVGAKTFAIQLVDEERGRMRTLAAEGMDRAKVPEPAIDGAPAASMVGSIAQVIASGEPLYDETRLRARLILDQPAIVVPIKMRDRVVGAIVVWDLLVQKTALADVDYELFNLLGAHAAAALIGAKLSAELNGRPPALWAAADLV
jgi:nitrate/nitrite-specific signal transduction histidine kinase